MTANCTGTIGPKLTKGKKVTLSNLDIKHRRSNKNINAAAGTTIQTVNAPLDLFLMNPNIRPFDNKQFLATQYDRQATLLYIARNYARPVTREELRMISGGKALRFTTEGIISEPNTPSACDYHVPIIDGNPRLWDSVCSARMQECLDANVYNTVLDVFDPTTGVTTTTPIVGHFPGLYSRAHHFTNSPIQPETTDWAATV